MQNVSPPSLRAVVYSRVSTEAQVEGTSLDHQEKESLRWCREHAAQVVDVIRDEGVSGAAFLTRPGIQRALSLIKSGQANVLVCYKVDRASRDLGALLAICEEVRLAGSTMVFSDGTVYAENAAGNAMLAITGVFAAWERGAIQERMIAGRVDLLKLGVQPSRSCFPYGYRIVRTKDVVRGERPAEAIGSYEIVEEQAHWVRWMFDQYVAGLSVYRITVGLSDAGVPAPRSGGRWNIGTVQKILSNPVYKGTVVARKWQRFEDEGRVGSIKNGRVLKHKHFVKPRKNSPETIELPAPPIVSEELWTRCQEMKASAQSRIGGRPEITSLLTTLMKCPACGRGVTSHRKYYRCHYVAKTATYPCSYTRCVQKQPYDEALLDTLKRLSTRKDLEKAALMAHRRSHALQQAAPADTWQKIQQDEVALTKRERAIVEAQIAGIQAGADPGVYARLFTEIASDRQRIAARREDLERTERPSDLSMLLTATQRVQKACEALARVLDDSRVPMMEKRGALMRVIDKIVLRDNGMEIHFIGFDEPVKVKVIQ